MVGIFRVSNPYPSVEFVPQMLTDRGQIWTVRQPIEWDNVMISLKVTTNFGYMAPGLSYSKVN